MLVVLLAGLSRNRKRGRPAAELPAGATGAVHHPEIVTRTGRLPSFRSARYGIRDVQVGDGPALAALERSSPENARLVVQISPRVDYLDLAARYPGVRGYVAVDPDTTRLVGVLFTSVAPTQLNGSVVPGAYLFSLRVHPSSRRRGIASALIEHAWQRAGAEADARVAWAGVREGNSASLLTFGTAGFSRLRDIAVRIIPPVFSPRADRPWTVRPARQADLPVLASALNRAHATHNFWRPCTPESLGAELTGAHHSLTDVPMVQGTNGAILASGAVFDLERVADLRLLGHQRLPDRLNRILARLLASLPLRPLVLRYSLLSPERAEASLALLRSVRTLHGSPLSGLVIPMDRRDSAWPLVARPWGLTTSFHVLARSAVPIDESRPSYVG